MAALERILPVYVYIIECKISTDKLYCREIWKIIFFHNQFKSMTSCVLHMWYFMQISPYNLIGKSVFSFSYSSY